MNNIVKVDAPSFYINQDDPYEISYDPNLFGDIKWRGLSVGKFIGDLPQIKNHEIFYLYGTDRGCIIDGIQYRERKIKN